MNELGAILGSLFLLVCVVALMRGWFGLFVEMWHVFLDAYHKARNERLGIVETIDLGYGSVSVVTSDSHLPPSAFEPNPRVRTRVVTNTALGSVEEHDEFDVLPSERPDWAAEIKELTSRNSMLQREIMRMSNFFRGKQVIILTDSDRPDKAPSTLTQASSVVWIKTPRSTEASAQIYDCDIEDDGRFKDVGQGQYGRVTQVLTNQGDTLVRLQTLTAPNVLAIADEIGKAPRGQRKTRNMPPHIMTFLNSLSAEDLDRLKDFTGLDQNEPVSDGMAVGSHRPRNIDLGD